MRIRRQERGLNPDAPSGKSDLVQMSDGLIDAVHTAPSHRIEMWHPKRIILIFAFFHRVGDISGLVLFPAHIDQDGQVTPVTDCIHRREKDEFVPTQQVLNIVFRRDQQRVKACVLHQAVQMLKAVVEVAHINVLCHF